MNYDYHVHSNYSDGGFLGRMAEAAADAGLDGVGFADHCNVADRDSMREQKARYGFNLDRTYDRRRDGIEAVRESVDVELFDAVEMDYDPRDECDIRTFFDDAGFDYAVGSVHTVEGLSVQHESGFVDLSESRREEVVDRYFATVRAMVGSELFEVAAHPDLVERNPALRGLATRDHYEAVADAFARSRTVPEINAGTVLDDDGGLHPRSEFLDVLLDRGIEFSVGTDSHWHEEVGPKVEALEELLDERGIEPVAVHEL